MQWRFHGGGVGNLQYKNGIGTIENGEIGDGTCFKWEIFTIQYLYNLIFHHHHRIANVMSKWNSSTFLCSNFRRIMIDKPWQIGMMQISVWYEDPVQYNDCVDGGGLSHRRSLFLYPPPQVWLQVDHEFHDPQLPFTEVFTYSKIYILK